MLNLPIYLLKNSYYVHFRHAGKQVKRSLRTSNRAVAVSRAVRILESVKMPFRKFEIDLSRGVFKADDAADYERMIDALGRVQQYTQQPKQPEQPVLKNSVSVVADDQPEKGLKLSELVEKFLLLKSHLRVATVQSYTEKMNDFGQFCKNPVIEKISATTISRYQEHLAKKGLGTRTIDDKISTIGTIFNFAIKQGYYFDKNPAAERSLQSKRDKLKNGYGIFEDDDIKRIFESAFFKESRKKDPDYYWAVVLGLITGCRASEISTLKVGQILPGSDTYKAIRITDSKTVAGERTIPVPIEVFTAGFEAFYAGKKPDDQIFKYLIRDGKGAGNAVGKKFARNIEFAGVVGKKLVLHSLRKYTNNFFMLESVDLEARCQYIGHELENVNSAVYTKKLRVAELFTRVYPSQRKIMEIAKIA